MAEARSYLTALLLLLVLTPCCFLGVQELAVSAHAQGGIVGQLVGEFKRGHDEAELNEIRERAPQTREERQEAREQAEQAAMQSDEQATASSEPAEEG
jgi:hypothetical protein